MMLVELMLGTKDFVLYLGMILFLLDAPKPFQHHLLLMLWQKNNFLFVCPVIQKVMIVNQLTLFYMFTAGKILFCIIFYKLYIFFP